MKEDTKSHSQSAGSQSNLPGSQPTRRGLHNWKNLFRKPNGYEWTILFMLIMGILMSFYYKADTAQCRAFVAQLPTLACQICNINTTQTTTNPYSNFSLPNSTIFVDSSSQGDNKNGT